ncbi:MAG: putative hydratase [Nocardioides sp.]|jgi:2-keto-4-pentenoate hydratase|nr:putative hydratase [Nocardioides sp.]
MTSSPPQSVLSVVRDAAERLEDARRRHQPCAPVRDLIGAADVGTAYAVQQLGIEARLAQGGSVVGRKIGLTSPAVQAQLGVDQPDFGVLLADMAYDDGAVVPMSRLLQPKVEAEVAFVLDRDLDDGPLDDRQVRHAVGYAVAAVEIVDSRVDDWDITFADTVADNASSGLFVLGARHVSLAQFRPVAACMTLSVNGREVSRGDGKACLGDPLLALGWLARTARELGDPLRAGQVVLSGALGPMVPAAPGDVVSARISGLGGVYFSFSDTTDGGPA